MGEDQGLDRYRNGRKYRISERIGKAVGAMMLGSVGGGMTEELMARVGHAHDPLYYLAAGTVYVLCAIPGLMIGETVGVRFGYYNHTISEMYRYAGEERKKDRLRMKEERQKPSAKNELSDRLT